MSLALNVGCGLKRSEFEGHEKTVNVDIRPEVKPELLASGFDLPFEAGSVGLVYTSHLLEHFTRMQGQRLLLRFHEALIKPGGKLWIVVPNIEWACVQVLRTGKVVGECLDFFWGHQDYKSNFHKTGFTRDDLVDFVRSLGTFKVLSCELAQEGRDITLKAVALELEQG